jgi:hypothetical protein
MTFLFATKILFDIGLRSSTGLSVSKTKIKRFLSIFKKQAYLIAILQVQLQRIRKELKVSKEFVLFYIQELKISTQAK